MTEPYEYQRKIDTTPEQGYQTTPVKPNTIEVEWQARQLKQLDPSEAPISKETTEIISSSPSATTLLEEYEFDADVSANDSYPLEKTTSVAKQKNILPESNEHSKLEGQIEEQIQIRPKEVEIFLKNDNLSEKIKNMSENELEEALENPEDYTDEQIDEIIARLDDLSTLEQNVQNEISSSDKLSLSEITEHIKNIESLAKVAITISEDGKFHSHSLGHNPKGERNAAFDPDTGVLSGSRDKTKNYRVGDLVPYIDETGERLVRITKIVNLSRKEEAAFQAYLEKNYQPTTIRIEEEPKTDEKTSISNTKDSRPKNVKDGEEREIANIDKKIDGLNLENISSGSTGKSSSELFLERLEKFQKEIKLLEEKIDVLIEKHENLVDQSNKDNLLNEIEKSDVKSNTLKLENLKIEDQYKAFLNELTTLKQEIPLPTQKKIREVLISIHTIEKQVSSDIGGLNKEEFIDHLVSLKKEVMTVTNEFLSTSGIQKTKGTNTQSKSEA